MERELQPAVFLFVDRIYYHRVSVGILSTGLGVERQVQGTVATQHNALNGTELNWAST